MSDKTFSFAEFPSYKVSTACNAWLRRRNDRIESKKEAMILDEMKPKKYLFGLYTRQLTREQAIKKLEDDPWSEYNRLDNIGYLWAERIESLLSLCRKNHDSVYVDADLFDCIVDDYES